MEFSFGLPKAKPGLRGRRDIYGRREIRRRIDGKKKAKDKRGINKIPVMFHTKCIAPQLKNLKWNTEPIWQIPLGLEVSSSVKYKFSLISNIFSYSTLKDAISSNIKNIRFRFIKNSVEEDYKEDAEIKAQIRAYYSRQELEWNMVHGLYLGLFRTKKLLRPLIYKWRIAYCIKHLKNVEDPVTLEVPKKLVRIIDFKQRMSFAYEANSIRRAIEDKILFSDYMFSEPLEPLNLLTNLPLTYGQLMSVILQCKARGEYSWILEELRARNGSLDKFKIYNRVRLNVEAIKTFFKKSNRIIRETVIDFLRAEADFVDLTAVKVYSFIRAYDMTPDNIMVRKWINHTREYYIAKELNYPGLMEKINTETEILLNMIYRLF